jgi:hypothetical protein
MIFVVILFTLGRYCGLVSRKRRVANVKLHLNYYLRNIVLRVDSLETGGYNVNFLMRLILPVRSPSDGAEDDRFLAPYPPPDA